MKVTLVLAALLALGLGAGCALGCEGQCEDDYRDCLADPNMTAVQCDIGFDQCLLSCDSMASPTSAAPDGG